MQLLKKVVLLLLFHLPLFALGQQNQQKKIDSVYRLLQQTKPDTNRLRLLNNYARMIRFDSMAKAMEYAQEALAYSVKMFEDYWIGQSHYSIGMIYFKQSKFDHALLQLDSAKKIFEKLKKHAPLAVCMNSIAEVYINQGKLANAIDVFHSVIKLSEKTGSKIEEGVAFGNIGVIYSDLDLHELSIVNYQKALQLFRAANDTMLVGLAIQNIAYAHYMLKRYHQSIQEFDSAIYLFKSVKRNDAVTGVKATLALALASVNRFDDAVEALREAISASEKRKNMKMICVNYISMGRVMYMAVDSLQTGKYSYDSAFYFTNKGLNLANEIHHVRQQSFGNLFLSEIYERQGKIAQAYNSHKKYLYLRDSLSGINKTQEIAIKDFQFDSDKKAALAAAKLERQKDIRNFLLAVGVLVLLLLFLLFLLYRRKLKTASALKEASLKTEIIETEMKALRAQMNPHFLFNSLNSISDYIAKNRNDLADEYLTKFARLMRLVLENSEKKEVILSSDLHALELYMQLEALRMNHKFTYEIKVDDSMDLENTLVPPLLLQPFVENSIWHGITQKSGIGKIMVSIVRNGSMISVVVEDDGVGLPQKTIAETGMQKVKQSLGMRITSERIALINKVKESGASMNIISINKGTRVELILPYNQAV